MTLLFHGHIKRACLAGVVANDSIIDTMERAPRAVMTFFLYMQVAAYLEDITLATGKV